MKQKKKCKRKKYVPKPIVKDIFVTVLERVSYLEDHPSAITTLKAKNHAAMERLTLGQGDKADMDTLIECLNVSIALTHIREGLGGEFASEIKDAEDALYQMACRGRSREDRFIFTAKEMEIVNYFLNIYDAQLSAATVGELETAGKIVNEKIRKGTMRKIKPMEKQPNEVSSPV